MSARVLMVQGCTSDAGKSTLVAALCRWLHRRGVAVAPFKPQNMALNSAVTVDGGEIGRAQALQAIAAGVEPHTDMNPVLLKPSSDIGAQVIIHGRVRAEMNARDYHQYKTVAMQAVLESLARIGLDDAENLRERFAPPATPLIARVVPHARFGAQVGRSSDETILQQALLLGLCTAYQYDPARPVLWTRASLTRRVELYEPARFYA